MVYWLKQVICPRTPSSTRITMLSLPRTFSMLCPGRQPTLCLSAWACYVSRAPMPRGFPDVLRLLATFGWGACFSTQLLWHTGCEPPARVVTMFVLQPSHSHALSSRTLSSLRGGKAKGGTRETTLGKAGGQQDRERAGGRGKRDRGRMFRKEIGRRGRGERECVDRERGRERQRERLGVRWGSRRESNPVL